MAPRRLYTQAEARRLQRELNAVRDDFQTERAALNRARLQLTEARIEVAEWKRRFDLLLSTTGKNPTEKT